MIAFIKDLPDLVKVVLFILKALRDFGEARDRAVLVSELEKAVASAKQTKDTTDLERIVNR